MLKTVRNKVLDLGLLDTTESYPPLVLRLAVGAMMFPHGAQKLLGWFGGYGLDATMGYFTDTLGIPAVFAFLAIVAEFFGAIGLIVGCFTRVAALGVGITMLVAGVFSASNGFFMNWFGQQSGEGFEFHLLAVAMCVSLFMTGSGAFGVDAFLVNRIREARIEPTPHAV